MPSCNARIAAIPNTELYRKALVLPFSFDVAGGSPHGSLWIFAAHLQLYSDAGKLEDAGLRYFTDGGNASELLYELHRSGSSAFSGDFFRLKAAHESAFVSADFYRSTADLASALDIIRRDVSGAFSRIGYRISFDISELRAGDARTVDFSQLSAAFMQLLFFVLEISDRHEIHFSADRSDEAVRLAIVSTVAAPPVRGVYDDSNIAARLVRMFPKCAVELLSFDSMANANCWKYGCSISRDRADNFYLTAEIPLDPSGLIALRMPELSRNDSLMFGAAAARLAAHIGAPTAGDVTAQIL